MCTFHTNLKEKLYSFKLYSFEVDVPMNYFGNISKEISRKEKQEEVDNIILFLTVY